MPHREHQISPSGPVPSITPAPASDLAGSRVDKGKSVVVSGAPSHSISHSNGMPPKGGLSSVLIVSLVGARGCLPPLFIHEDLLLECERA